MNQKAGVWIDHRKAVIVKLADKGEEIQSIESRVEKHIRQPSGHARATDVGPEDQRDRAFMEQIGRYYDKVIAQMGAAEAVLILGPGEAKEELQARLASKPSPARTIVLEAADKMTDQQVAAKVRQHFHREPNRAGDIKNE